MSGRNTFRPGNAGDLDSSLGTVLEGLDLQRIPFVVAVLFSTREDINRQALKEWSLKNGRVADDFVHESQAFDNGDAVVQRNDWFHSLAGEDGAVVLYADDDVVTMLSSMLQVVEMADVKDIEHAGHLAWFDRRELA